MKKRSTFRHLIHSSLAAALLGLTAQAHAAAILTWQSSPDRGTTPGAPVPVANLTGGAWSRAGLGSGAFGSGSAIVSASGGNSGSLSTTTYLAFSVAPATGFFLKLDSLNLTIRAEHPTAMWTVRSSLDNYTANLVTPFNTSAGTQFAIPLSSAFAKLKTSVSFRIYIWNSGGSGATDGFGSGTTTNLDGSVNAITPDSDYFAVGDGMSHPISEWLTGGARDRGMGWTTLSQIQSYYSGLNTYLSGMSSGAGPLKLTDQIDFVAIAEDFFEQPENGTIRFPVSTPQNPKVYMINRPFVVGKIVNGALNGSTLKALGDTATTYGTYNLFKIVPASSLANPPKRTAGTQCTWTGGTLDGNKDNVDWPGTTTLTVHPTHYTLKDHSHDGDADGGTAYWENLFSNAWAKQNFIGNCGLIGVYYVDNVTFNSIVVQNTVGDGIAAGEAVLATFTSCVAQNGAPLNYDNVHQTYGDGRESTFFKARQDHDDNDAAPKPRYLDGSKFAGGTMTVTNPLISGSGSIGIQLTSDNVALPGSTINISGPDISYLCISDMSQNPIHVECADNVNIHDMKITAKSNTTARIHIGNGDSGRGGGVSALIQNVWIDNGSIDFSQGSKLNSMIERVIGCIINNKDANEEVLTRVGYVSGCTLSSTGGGITMKQPDMNFSYTINGLADNVTITGCTGSAINTPLVVTNCHLTNSGTGVGIQSASVNSLTVSGTDITGVTTGISTQGGVTDISVSNCTIHNCLQNGLKIGTCNSLTVDHCDLQNFGLGTGLAAGLRAGIGGNVGPAPGGADPLSVTVKNHSTFTATAQGASTTPMLLSTNRSHPTIIWTTDNVPSTP